MDQPPPDRCEGQSIIAWLGVPTRDRPLALARCLRSHLAEARAAGRRLNASVIDSSTAAGAAANRAVAAAAASEHACQVHLVGADQRRSFAARLAAAAEVPPSLAAFALDGVGDARDTGCNRNALLLAHAGQVFLSSDDDVVTRAHLMNPDRALAERGSPAARSEEEEYPEVLRRRATPRTGSAAGQGDGRIHEMRSGPRGRGAQQRLGLTAAANPTDVRLFPDEAAALAAAPPWPGSLIEAHERLIGRSVPGRPRTRVRVTSSGLVGDCGSRYPAFHLWQPGARAQLEAVTDDEFRALVESRQVLRAVPAPTVTSGPFLMTTHVAFDHRRLLPPFFPSFRGQDLIFGLILRCTSPDSLIGHLPQVVHHRPAIPRRAHLDRLWPPGDTISFALMLEGCLALAAPALDHLEDEQARLRRLGARLVELTADPPALREQLLQHRARALDAQATSFAEVLAGATDSAWRRALQSFLREQEEGLAALEPLAPVELVDAGVAAASAATLGLLRQFGQLLERWPDLVAAARALDAAGHGLLPAAAEPPPRPVPDELPRVRRDRLPPGPLALGTRFHLRDDEGTLVLTVKQIDGDRISVEATLVDRA